MTFTTPLEEIFWREVFLRCIDKGAADSAAIADQAVELRRNRIPPSYLKRAADEGSEEQAHRADLRRIDEMEKRRAEEADRLAKKVAETRRRPYNI